MCLLDREVNENVVFTGKSLLLLILFLQDHSLYSNICETELPLFSYHLVQISTTSLTSVLRLASLHRNLRTALAQSPYFSTMATPPFSGILAGDGWEQNGAHRTRE